MVVHCYTYNLQLTAAVSFICFFCVWPTACVYEQWNAAKNEETWCFHIPPFSLFYILPFFNEYRCRFSLQIKYICTYICIYAYIVFMDNVFYFLWFMFICSLLFLILYVTPLFQSIRTILTFHFHFKLHSTIF